MGTHASGVLLVTQRYWMWSTPEACVPAAACLWFGCFVGFDLRLRSREKVQLNASFDSAGEWATGFGIAHWLDLAPVRKQLYPDPKD